MEKPQIMCIVAFAIYLLGLLFFLCGFGGDYWIDIGESEVHQGLWKLCVLSECGDIKLDDSEDWFKATVAMMILALICAIIGGVGFLILVVAAVLQCVAGLFTLIAIIIYGAEMADLKLDEYYGWSYILAIISGIIFLLNGIFVGYLAKEDGFNMKPKIPCKPAE